MLNTLIETTNFGAVLLICGWIALSILATKIADAVTNFFKKRG